MSDYQNEPNFDIVKPVFKEADLFLDSTFKQFKDTFMDHVAHFGDLMGQSLQSGPDEESLTPEERLCASWTRVDTWLEQLKDWADFSAYPELRAGIDASCRKTFQTMIEALPKTLELYWEEGFLTPGADDSSGVRLYKAVKRVQRRLLSWRLRCMNVFRSEKKVLAKDSHHIYLQNFARLHILSPYCDFLTDVMDNLLGQMSKHLITLHDLASAHVTGFLGLDKEKNEWSRAIIDGVHTMAYRPVDTNAMMESLDVFFAESRKRFDTLTSSLEKIWAHAYHFAGTVVLPHGRYGGRRFKKVKIKQAQRFNQVQDLWKRHYQGEGKDWTHDVALCRIQIQVPRKTFETLGSVMAKIDSQILPQCNHAIETLMKTKERLGAMETAGEWLLKKNMIHESRTLIRNFRRELLPAIANRVLGSGISQDLNAIIRLAKDKANNLAETHTVFNKRDTHIPPRSEMAEIPIRELFNEEFLIHLQDMLDTFQQNLRIRLDDTVNGMAEIRQIVEFNLETSFNLLDKEDYTDDAYTMVIEGIERSIKQLTQLMDQIRDVPEGIRAELGGIGYEWILQIQKILDNEKLIALKLKLAKAKATGRLKKWMGHLDKRRAHLWETLKSLSIKYYGQAQDRYLELRSYLGFSLPDEDVQIQFTQFLLETRQKLKALPFVYQQLFQIEPLSDDRLFQGRKAELQALKDEVASLDKNGGFLCAVVGEKGSGKTTLINILRPDLPQTHIIHILEVKTTLHDIGELMGVFNPLRPDAPFESMDNLIEYLVSGRSRYLLIVENMQNLFTKSMDGFDLLEIFLELLNQTRDHVAWVCSCTLYSWNYLDKSMGISNTFNRVVTLKPFAGDEIESMILSRHRITGYQLKFLVTRNIRLSRAYKKLTTEKERQAHLKKIFFDQIQNVASGNISVAILFWLRSIETIREHELHLSSQVDFNVKFLSHLSIEDRFTLGAIVQHDALTIKDHSVIFRQPLQKSRLVLQNLTKMGILQQDEVIFRVHPFLYRHVVRSLKLQNILH